MMVHKLSLTLSPSLLSLSLSLGFAFEILTRVIEVQKQPNGSVATLAPPSIGNTHTHTHTYI